MVVATVTRKFLSDLEDYVRACTGCLATKADDMFYANKGKPLSRCKECVKAQVRTHYSNNRKKYSDYERRRTQEPERKKYLSRACAKHRSRNPAKYKARTAVTNAIRSGRLIPEPCKTCGTTKRVQAHHADYSKPLEVTWECFKCHREQEHGQVVTAPDDGRGPKLDVPV
jgi:hypothetical protein